MLINGYKIEVAADLRGANLRDADLRGANLRDADLRDADLWCADLRGANLRGADLRGANLTDADLWCADLRDADLRDADLRGADLRGADLRDADLRGANLRDADLRGADLRDADLRDANLPHFQIPQTGTLEVWGKKCGTIVKMLVPASAKRTASLVGRKCRAEYVVVLDIEGLRDSVVNSRGGLETVYTIGKEVYPDSYDDDIRRECTNGIHFFLTREEAEEW